MRSLRHFAGNNRVAAIATLIAIASLPASAQSLAGRVVDEHSHLPLRGVRIAVVADSARVVSTTMTDTIGAFYADLPAAGTYRVRISVDSTPGLESAAITVRDSAYVEREFAVSLEERIYMETEVTSRPQFLSTSIPPKYPVELQAAELDGEVIADFVIDVNGRVRPGSFNVVKASDPRFGAAFRRTIESAHFRPAQKDGVAVAMRTRQRFTFRIDKIGFEPGFDSHMAPTFPKPVVQ